MLRNDTFFSDVCVQMMCIVLKKRSLYYIFNRCYMLIIILFIYFTPLISDQPPTYTFAFTLPDCLAGNDWSLDLSNHSDQDFENF